jgi:hypothetical protein
VLRDGSLYGKGFTFASASLGGAVHDQQLLTALLAAAVTVITTLLAWIGGRRKQSVEADKTQAETEHTVSQGFQLLVSKLQEERRELMRVIDEQSEEITALRSEVRALTRQVVKLENVITKAGRSYSCSPRALAYRKNRRPNTSMGMRYPMAVRVRLMDSSCRRMSVS